MTTKGDSDGLIRILGAEQNNLKRIDVEIPVNHLTVVTGVSGSGKSSLVFDTLYAEGQRRYVESLSAYARQFLERIERPRVHEITGISPAISIRQKSTSRNPRSTVGTVTEIYDYLRLFYSRAGIILCRQCGREVKKDTIEEVIEQLLRLPAGVRVYLAFPFRGSSLDLTAGSERALPIEEIIQNLIRHGFHRLLCGSEIRQLPDSQSWSLQELQQAQVLVDRLVLDEGSRERLADSLETCYSEGNGVAEVHLLDPVEEIAQIHGRPAQGDHDFPFLRFTERFECQYCRIPYRSPEPRLFSFNNPYGACPTCQGFGNTINIDPGLVIPDPSRSLAEGPIDPFNKPRYRRFQKRLEAYAEKNRIPTDIAYCDLPRAVCHKIWKGDGSFPGVEGFFRYLDRKKYKMHVRVFISRYRGYTRCNDCEGERLCREARDVYVSGKRIGQLTALSIAELQDFFSNLHLPSAQYEVARRLLEEISRRIDFLVRVGLEYLTLDRVTSTLSGGEIQRIQLAAALSSSLVSTLYVLDEPSIGLHARDERRLIEILKELRDKGNTVVVVEHEREMIHSADHVVDLGPGAGELGGELIHSGSLHSLLKNSASMTGRYLEGNLKIPTPVYRRSSTGQRLIIRGARHHNLKNLTVEIPLGILVCVTGVSGCGKSTLVYDVLYAALKKMKGEWRDAVGKHDSVEGAERITEVIMVDQSPIGKTPRSNPVTYLKAYDDIRRIFSSLREARAQNFSAGDFSFNLPHGRCDTCQGAGTVVVEMQFLADVELVCEDCQGKRFKNRVLEICYRGKNINQVLDLTVQQALEFFKQHPPLVRKLKVLQEVGLGYLRLGQSATTLSGGEAQRLKLAAYLSRNTSARPLFIFDEPTTGLHFDDIAKLLRALENLLRRGASIIVVEHNLDMIKSADWVIDLGPEGGDEGGYLIASGTPEQIACHKGSHTGKFLRDLL
ncbi:MAG: excinuclease ABC subunit UvrA [Acidobacteria bacterium]|nr:excinuclease ABC subunit UvrA [Acidobacteriota bacterium]